MSRSKRKWHRADIMAELRKRGSSLAELARRNGFARCTMSWALMKPHARANSAISAALDVSLNELWPDWYGADGAPLSRRISNSDAGRSKRIPKAARQSEQTGAQESIPAREFPRRKAA